MEVKDYKITADQITEWGSGGILNNHALTWFAEVLNGDMTVEEAREDCLSIADEVQWKKETCQEEDEDEN